MSTMLGNVQFNTVDINPEEVAKALQTFLDRGSKITGVDLDELDLSVHTAVQNPKTAKISDLVKAGIPIFDAITWISANRPESHPLKFDQTKDADKCPSMATIALSVFYVYFMLITQARYPYAGNSSGKAVDDGSKPRIPAFLLNILGAKEPQEWYMKNICSFPPEKFNPEWIKFVTFGNFGREVLSRFGLGVAGYRMFGPFKLYMHKEDLPANLVSAYNFARAVASTPPTWAIHPITRDPAVLTKRGNLNKNLSNLVLECFSDEQIDEMVKARILFAKPIRDVQHRNYLMWEQTDDISGSSYLFRD
jgi:hypothetical protein